MTTTPNKNSKSILAQLLATENLSVHHDPSAKTAMMDVKNRKLILPVWKDMTNNIYDMLVGHEIGHALFTPFNKEKEDASDHKGNWSIEAQEIGGDDYGHIAMSYLNIIEDARIERLIKVKFPGLRRDFVQAYGELNKRNFFGIENNPPSSFIDRVNIFFKLGVSAEANIGIQFSPTEQVFVDRIASSTTFDDVVQIVKDIWDYETSVERDRHEQEARLCIEYVKNSDGDEDESGDDGEKDKNKTGNKGAGYSNRPFPPSDSTTDKHFDKNAAGLVDKKVENTCYYTLPDPNLKNIIITPEEIACILRECTEQTASSAPQKMADIQKENEKIDAETRAFIKSSEKSLAIMMKQFDMKKAADSHKRTLITKTGILDCVKMMKYKFSEDVFGRHLTIKEGKNHGIVMFIDWSGSMSDVIKDTVKQCFLIALFCKRVGIPFEVYSFTSVNVREEIYVRKLKNTPWNSDITPSYFVNGQPLNEQQMSGFDIEQFQSFSDPVTGNPLISDDTHSYDFYPVKKGLAEGYAKFRNFSLLNFASSSMTMKQLTNSLSNMLMVCRGGWHSSSCVPYCLCLGGTPLNEAIFVATKIVNEFQKKNNIQIMNTIFLTDGENCGSSFRTPSSHNSSFLVDKKRKETINIASLMKEDGLYKEMGITPEEELYYSSDTQILITLHGRQTGSNTIGFFILNSNTVKKHMTRYLTQGYLSSRKSYAGGNGFVDRKEMEEKQAIFANAKDQQYKKEGYCVAPKCPSRNRYKEMYIISGSSLAPTDENDKGFDDLEQGLSLTAVKSAFRKQMKNNSLNKNLLCRFIESICS